MGQLLDRPRLRRAFELLGTDFARRGLLIEIAVCGGDATMLQFDWRQSTEDVGALVKEGFDERVIEPSVKAVAAQMNLDENWLNNAVGMFTPLREEDALFEAGGSYPPSGEVGLRILLANPRYLLAMKLCALASLDRGDKDMGDARELARHLGITVEDDLVELYRSIHGEKPPLEAEARFPSVVGD